MKNDKNLRALLRHCDKRFYPYIFKILNRLPDNVRNKDILINSKLKVISFDGMSYNGLFVPFGSPVENVIILNEKQY